MVLNKAKEKTTRKEHSTEESEDESTSSESETTETESDSDESSSESTTTSTSSSASEDEKAQAKSKTNAKPVDVNQNLKKKRTTKAIRSVKGNATSTPKKTKKRRRKPRPLTICLTNCRYEIVRSVAKKFTLLEVGEDESWNIYWTDFSVSLERAMDMRRYQLVNHFPGMNEICRKDLLSRNLNRMKRLFLHEYDIFPKTWSLPADLGDLQTYAHNRKNKTYICKPEMGCQGRGIFLIRNIKDLNPFGKIICQMYVSKPFLIDNFKFDLRIYVLITTCDPLRIYCFNEGLARFATAKYKQPTNSNTENSYMHLTNYAVNKYSRDYVVDDEGGSKRKLSAVYRWLEQRSYDTEELINNIDDVIIKTIISAHPILKHNYRTCFPHHDLCSACFEILGFDILLDYKLKPYVLEVNHSPSFHTDSKLDKEIKEGLLHDTFAMLNMKQLDRYKVESDDRKRIQERLLRKNSDNNTKDKETLIDGMTPQDHQFQWELEHCGNYRLIYPSPTSDKYDKYFEQNLSSLYHETAASQARANCTRNQMEEYHKLKQQEERKRQALSQHLASKENKDKVRPESPADADKPKVKRNKQKQKELSGFVPRPIIADEELDRMKSLMQRGMLIRSLGIELQVFKLLCQIGNLKPEEEKIFRRMHGFTNVQQQQQRSQQAEQIKPGLPTSNYNNNNTTTRPEAMEQLQKGEPMTVPSHGDPTNNKNDGGTNRGDYNYPTSMNISNNMDTAQQLLGFDPNNNNNNGGQKALEKTNAPSVSPMKNPYNVPYNSPAHFANPPPLPPYIPQNRPKSSPFSQSQVGTIQNISNFMDRVKPPIEDVSATPGPTATQLAERRYYHPRYPQSDNNARTNGSQIRTQRNLQMPPRTAGLGSPANGIITEQQKSRSPWAPPPLASHQSQFNEDTSKFRIPILAAKQIRPQETAWPARSPRNHLQPTARRVITQQDTDSDPVQCTQMFFNDKGVPGNNFPATGAASARLDSRQGNMTHLNFLRGVGNVALLRAGRINSGAGQQISKNGSNPAAVSSPATVVPLAGAKVNQNNFTVNGITIGQESYK